jgi:predicted nucleic acid-binding protein
VSQLALVSGYCLDANIIIDLCRRRYPKHRFRRLWDQFEGLLAAGAVVAPEEVLLELERQEGNSAYAWARENKGIFVAPDLAQLTVVSKLLGAVPSLAEATASRTKPGFGDPFVVALAEVRAWTAVTDEGMGKEGSPQIPRLCALRNVHCINLLGLFDEQNWDL